MAKGVLGFDRQLQPSKTQTLTIWPFAEKKFLTPDVEQEFSNCSMHQSHHSAPWGLPWTWQSAVLVGWHVAPMLLVPGLHTESHTARETHQISLFHSSNRMHTYHQICFVAADRQLRHLFLLVLWPNFQIFTSEVASRLVASAVWGTIGKPRLLLLLHKLGP